MSTLCFGGSFNPIHNGHLRCARDIAQNQDFHTILLIPSARPPHKPEAADLASAQHRLSMCQLVADEDVRFQVTDVEIHRQGPSYTIDTVRQLKDRGMTTVHWLIGADMLNDLPRWHEPLALLDEVNFIVMARPGYRMNWDELPQPFQKLKSNVVDAPQIDISATEIRRRVKAGESITGLVPNSVARYIAEHGLYR